MIEQKSQAPLMLTLCLGGRKHSGKQLSAGRYWDYPKQIQMLINDQDKMLLLRPCALDDKEAIVIPSYPLMQFEMSGYSLLRRVRRLTDWPDMRPRVIYGEFLPQYRAITFNLRDAQTAQLRMPQEYTGHLQ